MSNLLEQLTSRKLQSNNCEKFKFLVTILLDSHALMKERYVRCNQKRCRFAKETGKAIMITLLLNKFKKDFSKENHKAYQSQQHFLQNSRKQQRKISTNDN